MSSRAGKTRRLKSRRGRLEARSTTHQGEFMRLTRLRLTKLRLTRLKLTRLNKTTMMRLGLGLLFASGCYFAQAPRPDGAGVEPGELPTSWITGGPRCMEVPDWQVHEYNA